MTSNDQGVPLPKWTDFENRNIVRIAGMVFVAWIFFGMLVPLVWTSLPDFVIPQNKYQVMGQFGDMFGAVNSLFSGFAFFAAIVAILGQTAEMRESGKRQLEQEKMQLRQMELAETTAEIQAEVIKHQRQIRLETHFEKLMDVTISIKSKCRLYWELLERSDKQSPLSERTVLLPVVDELTRLLATLEKLRLQSAIMFRKKSNDLLVVLNSVLSFTHSLVSETQQVTKEEIDLTLKLWELQLAKAIIDLSVPADPSDGEPLEGPA